MLFFYSTFTWKHWIGLLLTTAAYVIPYRQLASMAKPAYHDDGELLDGGFDMSTGGVCGYVFLLLFSVWFFPIFYAFYAFPMLVFHEDHC